MTSTEGIFRNLLRVVQAETVWRQGTGEGSVSLLPASLREGLRQLAESLRSTGKLLSTAETQQLATYLVKVVVRLLQVSVSASNAGRGKDGKQLEAVKQQLGDVLETFQVVVQQLGPATSGTDSVLLDIESLTSIYYHLSYVFVVLLLPTSVNTNNGHNKGGSGLTATDEHLLLLTLQSLFTLFQYLTINVAKLTVQFVDALILLSTHNSSNKLDWLANLVHSLLTLVQHSSAKPITNHALFVLNQVLIMSKGILFDNHSNQALIKALKAFWRSSLPGVFSTLVNFCAQKTVKRGSTATSASLQAILHVLHIVANDIWLENRVLLRSMAVLCERCTDSEKESMEKEKKKEGEETSNNVVFEQFLRTLQTKGALSSSAVNPAPSCTVPQDDESQLRQHCIDFTTVAEMQQFRVNVLQRILAPFVHIYRSNISTLSSAQMQTLLDVFATVLQDGMLFFGVKCWTAFFVLFLMPSQMNNVHSALAGFIQQHASTLLHQLAVYSSPEISAGCVLYAPIYQSEVFQEVNQYFLSLLQSTATQLPSLSSAQVCIRLQELVAIVSILNTNEHSVDNTQLAAYLHNNTELVLHSMSTCFLVDVDSSRQAMLLETRSYPHSKHAQVDRYADISVETGYYRTVWQLVHDEESQTLSRTLVGSLAKHLNTMFFVERFVQMVSRLDAFHYKVLLRPHRIRDAAALLTNGEEAAAAAAEKSDRVGRISSMVEYKEEVSQLLALLKIFQAMVSSRNHAMNLTMWKQLMSLYNAVLLAYVNFSTVLLQRRADAAVLVVPPTRSKQMHTTTSATQQRKADAILPIFTLVASQVLENLADMPDCCNNNNTAFLQQMSSHKTLYYLLECVSHENNVVSTTAKSTLFRIAMHFYPANLFGASKGIVTKEELLAVFIKNHLDYIVEDVCHELRSSLYLHALLNPDHHHSRGSNSRASAMLLTNTARYDLSFLCDRSHRSHLILSFVFQVIGWEEVRGHDEEGASSPAVPLFLLKDLVMDMLKHVDVHATSAMSTSSIHAMVNVLQVLSQSVTIPSIEAAATSSYIVPNVKTKTLSKVNYSQKMLQIGVTKRQQIVAVFPQLSAELLGASSNTSITSSSKLLLGAAAPKKKQQRVEEDEEENHKYRIGQEMLLSLVNLDQHISALHRTYHPVTDDQDEGEESKDKAEQAGEDDPAESNSTPSTPPTIQLLMDICQRCGYLLSMQSLAIQLPLLETICHSLIRMYFYPTNQFDEMANEHAAGGINSRFLLPTIHQLWLVFRRRLVDLVELVLQRSAVMEESASRISSALLTTTSKSTERSRPLLEIGGGSSPGKASASSSKTKPSLIMSMGEDVVGSSVVERSIVSMIQSPVKNNPFLSNDGTAAMSKSTLMSRLNAFDHQQQSLFLLPALWDTIALLVVLVPKFIQGKLLEDLYPPLMKLLQHYYLEYVKHGYVAGAVKEKEKEKDSEKYSLDNKLKLSLLMFLEVLLDEEDLHHVMYNKHLVKPLSYWLLPWLTSRESTEIRSKTQIVYIKLFRMEKIVLKQIQRCVQEKTAKSDQDWLVLSMDPCIDLFALQNTKRDVQTSSSSLPSTRNTPIITLHTKAKLLHALDCFRQDVALMEALQQTIASPVEGPAAELGTNVWIKQLQRWGRI